ncbi:circadian locomoter output cycles protein kaput isoform X2 [Chrysoperla carnea]|uniref:circadian locomoter output cycles protein kaput isoform X2 n=1 Tax=Chrysoperla carnea TaxID=189513 RepID=UPI001D05FAD7|nr:circadian locomoter output cycles protein kaput isoform X2 [Chrysoperla carnea]
MSTSSFMKRSCRRSNDMDEDNDDKDDTKRKSRNLSEKKRRDQFNMLVNELSSMVSTGSRKMDKSTVLKSTIAFLKNHNEIAVRSRAHEIQEDWKPAFLSNEEFTHLILEALDGFMMVFSSSGQIFYASESVTSLLGYLPNDLLNMTIYDMVYEEEQSTLYAALLGPAGPDSQVSFSCHLRRGGPPSESPSYELIHFVGYFRSDIETPIADNNRFSGFSGELDSRLVFVGTGRLQVPQLIREMSVVDSSKSEFTSRHSLEWKFLFLDHRAPPIIGYLPFEVLGTSGYDYYHVDDLDDVVSCHESLMQKGEGTSCYYRFLTKGQQWIWLQTRFYITYHQWNSKPEFIVCTHRVVSYADVMKQDRKNSASLGTDMLCVSPGATTVGSNNAPSPWPSQSQSSKMNRSHRSQAPPSDCSSMSADSPASRQTIMTHHSSQSHVTRNSIRNHIQVSNSVPIHQTPQQNHQQSVQQQHNIQAQPTSTLQFVEQPQFVAAIPVQPVLATFTAPMVSPLQIPTSVSADSSIVLTNPTSQQQVQAQLQRKHAELQALIGQQQAELRRVSEQLVMARLGILPSNASQQQPSATSALVTVPYVCSGGVSSTTNTIQCSNPGMANVQIPVSALDSSLVAPLSSAPMDDTTAFSLTQQQAQMLFASPNPNISQHNKWFGR